MTLPIFSEQPSFQERHPLNYLAYLGAEMKRYRCTHPNQDAQSATGFIENIISTYTDKPVGRQRITRAEEGNLSVEFVVYAAYFSEMGIWPDIINAINFGEAPTARYMHFIKGEVKADIASAAEEANKNVSRRLLRERNR